ncbi:MULTISPECIES: hypothetical protein [Arcobacteraceae]|nr:MULTISPECIES: hypothetical protein [Arcobacteraceae]
MAKWLKVETKKKKVKTEDIVDSPRNSDRKYKKVLKTFKTEKI